LSKAVWCRLKSRAGNRLCGGKGVLTVSQIATGEENNLSLRVHGSKGAVLWRQEMPDSLKLYRYGKPRQVLTRGHREYLSSAATDNTRIPKGHPEGYLKAFANVYRGAISAVRCHIEENSIQITDYNVPTVYDGLRGLQFI
jgi:predicted dehydrogenase